jgi:hypothetical protein
MTIDEASRHSSATPGRNFAELLVAASDGGCAASACAEAAKDDVPDGPVHGVTHDHAENRAAAANKRAGHDQQVVREHEAGGGGGPTGVGVEQRDDDGHIGSADRGDQVDAQQQRNARHDVEPKRPVVTGRSEEGLQHHQHGDDEAGVEEMSPWQQQRLAGERAPKLRPGQYRACERDPADANAHVDLDVMDRVRGAANVDGGRQVT